MADTSIQDLKYSNWNVQRPETNMAKRSCIEERQPSLNSPEVRKKRKKKRRERRKEDSGVPKCFQFIYRILRKSDSASTFDRKISNIQIGMYEGLRLIWQKDCIC